MSTSSAPPARRIRRIPGRSVLSRRAVLRGSVGAGFACVGLPLLEAMLNSNGDALAGGAALPKQLVVYFIGNGFRLDRFEPAQTGAAFSLSEELAPLAGVEDYVKVVTGLQNWCDNQITHHEGMTAFNGYSMIITGGLSSNAGGPTLDQVVADYISNSASPPPIIRSIEVGVSPKLSTEDGGFTMHNLSHRGPQEPLQPKFNPQQVWTTLFGEFVDAPDDSVLRLAIVDAVREDAKKLRERLGSIDRVRIDAHLDGLNELENKIKAAPPVCEPPEMPSETNPENTSNDRITEVNNLMADLVVHAFKCDITRVASMLMVGGVARTTFTEIGQTSEHHVNTHSGGAQGSVHDGVVYQMQRLADFAAKMRAEVDVTGKNLLDSGLIMMGSDCSEGVTHSVSRQPFVLIGKLQDTFTGKYHFQKVPRTGTPGSWAAAGSTSDVLMTVLKAFDPAAQSIGSMTPTNLNGGWYGSGGAPNSMYAGSNTIISEITGPEFTG